MKNKLLVFIFITCFAFSNTQVVFADTATSINNGLNFLKSKQDSTGKITQGYSSPSEWAGIAFGANGIDTSTIKNPDTNLKDYLLTDQPSSGATATDWENRILAIIAISGDPTNFGGVNYLQNLEGFYNNHQLGETYLLNDDIFGLLALIASGSAANKQIEQDVLSFIITHQVPNGAFSWSPDTTCQYCDPSADMTGAALQALQAAKDNGLTNPNLDNAISNAKNYLLSNQNPDGGFGYSGSSDADSTSWVLMAFNNLGIGNTVPTTNAINWLLSSQQGDGGFPSYSGSDSTTTSHALIALSGKSWLLHILTALTPSATPSASPTPSPSTTPTPSPSASPTSTPASANNNTPTPSSSPTSTPTPSATPTPTPLPTPLLKLKVEEVALDQSPTPTPSPEVLGEAISTKTEPDRQQVLANGFKSTALPVAGAFGLFTTFKFLEERRWKK